MDKMELFEYQKYCLCRDYRGKVYNLSDREYLYHIDREFIEFPNLLVKDLKIFQKV